MIRSACHRDFHRLVRTLVFAALCSTLVPFAMRAQSRPASLDPTPVPAYTLPDLLIDTNGARISSSKAWQTTRRAELLELFSREVYGRTPAVPLTPIRSEITTFDRAALNGLATRKGITIRFGPGPSDPSMHLLV